MSYAEAAAHNSKQSPEEARAPQPRHLDVADSETNTSSLVDVDSPHVSSVPSNYESQSIKTNTQAERLEREEDEKERAQKREDEEARRRRAGGRGRGAGKAGGSLGLGNPVVLGNALLVTAAGAGLGFAAWQRHVRGELSWKVVGLWGGAVGAAGVVDYFVSKWLVQNKYPRN